MQLKEVDALITKRSAILKEDIATLRDGVEDLRRALVHRKERVLLLQEYMA